MLTNFIKYQIKSHFGANIFLIINIIVPLILSIILVNFNDLYFTGEKIINTSKYLNLYNVTYISLIFSMSYWIIGKSRRIITQNQILTKFTKISKLSNIKIKLANFITDFLVSIFVFSLPLIVYVIKFRTNFDKVLTIIELFIFLQIILYLFSEIILLIFIEHSINFKNLTIVFIVIMVITTSINNFIIPEQIKNIFMLKQINNVFIINFIEAKKLIDIMPIWINMAVLAVVLITLRFYYEKTRIK